MLDDAFFQHDPDRVRRQMADHARGYQNLDPGNWYVFETISADGSLAIGVARGIPDRAAVMVVYEGLLKPVALLAARGLVAWYRDNGREVVGESPVP